MSDRRAELKRILVKGLVATAGVAVLSHVGGLSVRENSEGGAHSNGTGLSNDNYIDPNEKIEPEVGNHSVLERKVGPVRGGLGRLSLFNRGPARVRAATCKDDNANDNSPCDEGLLRGAYEFWRVVYQPKLVNGVENGAFDVYSEDIIGRIGKSYFVATSPDIAGYRVELKTRASGLAYVVGNEAVTTHEIRVDSTKNPALEIRNLKSPIDPSKLEPTYVARLWFENQINGELLEGIVPLCGLWREPHVQIFPNGVSINKFKAGTVDSNPLKFKDANTLRLIREATH